MLDLSRLSAEQRQAVMAVDQPLLIEAGPGSGKTTVLAARIAYLVMARGVPPQGILALAFANKAARELRHRLRGVLGDRAESVVVTTFHAYGLWCVREGARTLGYGPGPLIVYDQHDARALLISLLSSLAPHLASHPIAEVESALTRFRLAEGDPPSSDLEAALPALAEAYDTALRRRQAIDFAAMLALPFRLFAACPEQLQSAQTATHHVLVDEFQDLSGAQYRILRVLADAHRRVTVVGDPCQSIYGWRGADVGGLQRFQADFPDCRVIRLHRNYRSTQRLVRLANLLGTALPFFQPLVTNNPVGQVARLHLAQDEAAEAAFVATEIARLHAVGHVRSLTEVGILYRTNRQAGALGLALRANAVPYHVRGRGDLLARREVRDALAYLRLAHDPTDVAAMSRLAEAPPHALTPDGAVALDRLSVLATELSAALGSLSLPLLLDHALDRSGYRAWLAIQADGAERLARLDEFRALLAHVEGRLGDWLEAIAVEGDGDERKDGQDRVLLSTIHSAKGSEWRVVFIVGCEEGLLPHARALAAPSSPGATLDEERRLAYVAVTRARELLYLTACRTRRRGSDVIPTQPSRFLDGLPLQTP